MSNSMKLVWSKVLGIVEDQDEIDKINKWRPVAFPSIRAVCCRMVSPPELGDDDRYALKSIKIARSDCCLNDPNWFSTAMVFIIVLHANEWITGVSAYLIQDHIQGLRIITNHRQTQCMGFEAGDATVETLEAPPGHFISHIQPFMGDADCQGKYEYVRALRVAYAPLDWATTENVALNVNVEVLFGVDKVQTFSSTCRELIRALVITCDDILKKVTVLSPEEFHRLETHSCLSNQFNWKEHLLVLESGESITKVMIECEADVVRALRLETTHGLSQWFGRPQQKAESIRVFEVPGFVQGFFGGKDVNGSINFFGVKWTR